MFKISHNISHLIRFYRVNFNYKNPVSLMDPLITNNQKFLAEQFCLGDVQVNKLSYNAVLIIKRWKLIRKIPAPVVAEIVHAHTERMIKKSFFTYVPNSMFLITESLNDYRLN